MSTVLEKEPGIISSPPQGGGGESPGVLWVSCVIRPEKLDPVKDALSQLNLIGGMTVTNVRGFGRQKGLVEFYRGGEVKVRMVDKVKLDLIIAQPDLEAVLETIKKYAQTGGVGDGKVFISEVNKLMRIRTGEMGLSAL